MELHVKVVLLPLALISLMIASCESVVDFSLPESADERFEDSRTWSVKGYPEKISAQTEAYSILFLADSHAGTTVNLDSVFNIAKASEVSAICLAGDLTSGNPDDYMTFEQSLPHQYELPTFLTPGNHDLWPEEGWTEYLGLFGPSSYCFTIETPSAKDLIIALDSGTGTLGNLQMAWLRNILENRRPACRHCIIFTHNDLFRVRHSLISNPHVEELTVLIDLFTRYNVEMVIAGHDHKPGELLFGNTRYIIAGAVSDTDPDPNYVKVTAMEDNIQVEFIDL